MGIAIKRYHIHGLPDLSGLETTGEYEAAIDSDGTITVSVEARGTDHALALARLLVPTLGDVQGIEVVDE